MGTGGKMKTIDLTQSLKKYTSGWVAIDKNRQVIAHAKTFESITKKIQKNPEVLLIPASKDYFGFVTAING